MATDQKQEERKCNYFRFYVGRPEQMGDPNAQIVFKSAIYAAEPAETVLGMMVGAAIGPADTVPQEKGDDKVKLSSGGIIVPARPSLTGNTVATRAYTYTDEKGTKHRKKYIDWAVFQEHGMGVFSLVPKEDDEDVCYFEITVGHLNKTDGTDQLILANMFQYGCVPYNGGKKLIMPKSTKKIAKANGVVVESDEVPEGDEGIRSSEARLVKKREGDMVGGFPLWTTFVYEIHFSNESSESVLVKQFGTYFRAHMVNRKPDFRKVDPKVFASRYEARLTPELAVAAA